MPPSRYWLIHAGPATHRVDTGTAERIKQWLNDWREEDSPVYEFEDLFGSTCVIFIGRVTTMYESTKKSRDALRMHDLEMDREDDEFNKANANFA